MRICALEDRYCFLGSFGLVDEARPSKPLPRTGLVRGVGIPQGETNSQCDHRLVHTLRDWIYSLPTWLSGSVIVLLAITLSLLGLACFHRFVPSELRRAHNDVAGFILAIVGVIYAVLLAFIAISTWEDFNKAQDSAELEANMVDNLYVDSAGLPPKLAFSVRRHLRDYTQLVIEKEWPAQQAGRINIEGWKPLLALNAAIARFRPAENAAAIHSEILHTANDLYRARRDRLVAAASRIPNVMWVITLLGGALTVGFSFLFGVPKFRIHLLMTGLLAASLALVIVLIVAFDCPFRGDLSVSADAYRRLYQRVVPAMTIDLNEVRSQEPDYRGMSDSMLADTIYTTYFSDLPREQFDHLIVSSEAQNK